MPLLGQLRLYHLSYFSKPAADRPIYRAIRRLRARKIVELGIGDGRRALRMIAAARLASPGRIVQYVGLDQFEDSAEATAGRLTLKEAHRMFAGAGCLVRLVPGEPAHSLVRVANSLGKVDLLLLSGGLGSASYGRFWFFVPRMLHQRSVVFVERDQSAARAGLEIISQQAIAELAAAGSARRAA